MGKKTHALLQHYDSEMEGESQSEEDSERVDLHYDSIHFSNKGYCFALNIAQISYIHVVLIINWVWFSTWS